MICYWSERCMLRPSLWFVTGQNTVCYDQGWVLLLVRMHYVTTKFTICYWSEHCMLRPSNMICYWCVHMLRPSLWFVTGQNAVCYDQVYDLLLVRTLYVTTKLMICYWSERCMLRPSLWFVTERRKYILIDCYIVFDQVYDLLLVRTLYVTTKFMICYWSEHCMLRPSLRFICYWSEHCMLRPSLWFVTGQNVVCYDQVYDLLLVQNAICYDK